MASVKEKMEEERKAFEDVLAAEKASYERNVALRRAAFEQELAQKYSSPSAASSQQPAIPTAVPTQLPEPAAAEQKTPSPEPAKPASPTPNPEACANQGTSKCATCAMKGKCGSGGGHKDEMSAEVAQRMSHIKHTVLVLSGKGGVGKSMVSVQLAFALANKGLKVGLMDLDICGPTVPKMLGARGRGVGKDDNGVETVKITENLSAMSIGFISDDDNQAVIWRGPRKMGLIQMFLKDVSWGDLDYLIIDTPPGTSDEHLSIVQLLGAKAITGAIMVTSPQDVAVIEVGREINFCQRMGIKIIGVVENFASFACPLCNAVTDIWPPTSGGGMGLAVQYDLMFLGRVPLDPALAQAGEEGVQLKSGGATTKAIESIATAVLQEIQKPSK